MKQPSAWTTLTAALRFEGSLLYSSLQVWALLFGLPIAGLATTFLDAPSYGPENLVGELQLAMFLTVVSAVLGCMLTANALHQGTREVLVARAADEWLTQLARVIQTGVLGTAVTILTYLALTLPHYHLLEPWRPLLNWLPLVTLAHLLAAALGGLAAKVSVRLPQAALPASFIIWAAWLQLPLLLGPTAPDLLLRALSWNNLLLNASSESLQLPLLTSFTFTILGVLTLSFMLLRVLHMHSLPPAQIPSRRVITATTIIVIAGLFVGTTIMTRSSKEATLVAKPEGRLVQSVNLNPRQTRLIAEADSGQHEISGPARPTAVSLSEQQHFAAYIGNHGVALPISRLQTEDSYSFLVDLPAGWQLYGCSEQTLQPTGISCSGTTADEDWLLILPSNRLHEEQQQLLSVDPAAASARALFMLATDRLHEHLTIPQPELLPVAESRPFWLSETTLAVPTAYGEQETMQRQAIFLSATATAARFTNIRTPNPAVFQVRRNSPDTPNIPLPLVAILDRLLFDLMDIQIHPDEPARRHGTIPNADSQVVRIPMIGSIEFNEWWLETDVLLADGHHAQELLDALTRIHDWNNVGSWDEVLAQ